MFYLRGKIKTIASSLSLSPQQHKLIKNSIERKKRSLIREASMSRYNKAQPQRKAKTEKIKRSTLRNITPRDQISEDNKQIKTPFQNQFLKDRLTSLSKRPPNVQYLTNRKLRVEKGQILNRTYRSINNFQTWVSSSLVHGDLRIQQLRIDRSVRKHSQNRYSESQRQRQSFCKQSENCSEKTLNYMLQGLNNLIITQRERPFQINFQHLTQTEKPNVNLQPNPSSDKKDLRKTQPSPNGRVDFFVLNRHVKERKTQIKRLKEFSDRLVIKSSVQ